MNKLFALKTPVTPTPVAKPVLFHAGHRYCINNPELALMKDASQDPQSGIIGAYRLDSHSAGSKPVDLTKQPAQCFVWDAGLLSPSVSACLQANSGQPPSFGQNRLNLHDAGLDGPEVRMQNDQPVLRISPRFDLEWATDAFPSQLGWVQVVESSRTVQFEDGESLVLLDTELAGSGPVLYLDGASDNLAVKPVCAFQQQGEKRRFGFTCEVTQIIPTGSDNKTVTSVSILEKYTCYFMQNAAPDDPEQHIWVPVHLPIVWAWSIRVQQRYDGVWDIFRKKLILPTTSTEAPALPHWQSNSVQCAATMDICSPC
ncbi:MAG: hypothetical protein PHR16_03465 [Methylovulum sp.]|nr:hypothetical protein [Methylovulum sp.]